MNSPSIQDSIVEATLFSLSGSTNNALRGKITSVSPGATSRRLFTVQGGNDIHYHYPAIEILSTTNVVVKVVVSTATSVMALIVATLTILGIVIF